MSSLPTVVFACDLFTLGYAMSAIFNTVSLHSTALDHCTVRYGTGRVGRSGYLYAYLNSTCLCYLCTGICHMYICVCVQISTYSCANQCLSVPAYLCTYVYLYAVLGKVTLESVKALTLKHKCVVALPILVTHYIVNGIKFMITLKGTGTRDLIWLKVVSLERS